MGIVVPAQGAEKERLLREAVALRRSLQGGSTTAMADLAEAYALLAHLLTATRRPGEGEELMSLARGIARRLKDDFPADPTCRHQVVLLESLIASPRYCAPADREAAVRAGRSVLEAKARLVADFPFIPDFRAELAWSHHYLSGLLRAAGRSEESEAENRRAVEAFEAVLKDHPSVESYSRLMASVCEDFGTTLAASDRPRDAVPYFQRALDLSPGSPMRRDRVGRLLAACRSRGAPVDAPAAPPSSGAGTAAGPSRVH
jgi:tetratricopeptide (TPR) repeat protein